MENMSELFHKMGHDDKAELDDGSVAIRKGDHLLWDNTDNDVDVYLILHGEWKLLREEEKGIETEKWMRVNSVKDGHIRFLDPSSGNKELPTDIMCRKVFLRWVGTMPGFYEWPGDMWCVWFRENGGGWHNCYDENRGYIKKIVADYAEMRVEK